MSDAHDNTMLLQRRQRDARPSATDPIYDRSLAGRVSAAGFSVILPFVVQAQKEGNAQSVTVRLPSADETIITELELTEGNTPKAPLWGLNLAFYAEDGKLALLPPLRGTCVTPFVIDKNTAKGVSWDRAHPPAGTDGVKVTRIITTTGVHGLLERTETYDSLGRLVRVSVGHGSG